MTNPLAAAHADRAVAHRVLEAGRCERQRHRRACGQDQAVRCAADQALHGEEEACACRRRAGDGPRDEACQHPGRRSDRRAGNGREREPPAVPGIRRQRQDHRAGERDQRAQRQRAKRGNRGTVVRRRSVLLPLQPRAAAPGVAADRRSLRRGFPAPRGTRTAAARHRPPGRRDRTRGIEYDCRHQQKRGDQPTIRTACTSADIRAKCRPEHARSVSRTARTAAKPNSPAASETAKWMTISSRPASRPIGSLPTISGGCSDRRHHGGGEREAGREQRDRPQLGPDNHPVRHRQRPRIDESRGSSDSASHDATATSAITIIEQVRKNSRSSTARIAVRPGDWMGMNRNFSASASVMNSVHDRRPAKSARARRADPSPARPGRSRGTAAGSAA